MVLHETRKYSKVNKMNRQLWNGRKYLQTISEKRLIPKIHKELLQIKKQKKKKFKLKMSKRPTCPKKTYSGKQVNEKVLNVHIYQGNANQNYGMTPYTCQKGYY